jgi:hypothetical protein
MRKLIFCTVLAAVLAVGVQAEPQKDNLLDHMTGHWILIGTIDGQQTTHDIAAQWVLQNTYVRLTEVSREKDAAGKPQYEAEVLIGYDAAKSRYTCFWFDITGIASPGYGGVALRQGDTLPFVFKMERGDFRTTFAYQAKTDTWTWAMDAEQGGKLESFARGTLSRH